MKAFSFKSTPKKNTDVLLHMMGFLKKILPKGEKKDILITIQHYQKELHPLIVPVTLIRHQVMKYDIDYLKETTHFCILSIRKYYVFFGVAFAFSTGANGSGRSPLDNK